jgi:MFS family permease
VAVDVDPIAEPAPAPKPRPQPLHRNRDFNLLWTGQAASTLGSQMSAVAYPLLILAVTRSAAQAGFVASAQLISTLVFLLPAGVIADRHPRKEIMVITSLIQMIAGATVVPAVLSGHVYLIHLMAVGSVQGISSAFYQGASRGATRRIVTGEQLPEAMAATQVRDRATTMIGPPAGGALFGISRALPFTCDAISYGAIALAAALIRKPLDPQHIPAREPLRRSLTTGVRFVADEPFLRLFAIWAALLNGVIFGVRLTVIVLARDRGATAVEVGTLLSISAACGLAGALVAVPITKLAGGRTLTLICSWTFVAASLGMIFAPSVWVIAVLAGITGFALAPVNVILTARSTLITPDHLQAQVSNTMLLCYTGLSSFTPSLFGALTDKFGAYPVITIATVIYGLMAVWLQANRSLHQVSEGPQGGTGDGDQAARGRHRKKRRLAFTRSPAGSAGRGPGSPGST